MPGVITGKHILYDATLVIDTVDLSDHVESITIEVGTNKQAAAAMGDIQDYDMPGTLTITAPPAVMFQDYAASKVYATLYTAWIGRTVFNLVGKASSGATSATNPQFTIPVFIGKMGLMGGKRGDRHMASPTFEVAGILSVATS